MRPVFVATLASLGVAGCNAIDGLADVPAINAFDGGGDVTMQPPHDGGRGEPRLHGRAAPGAGTRAPRARRALDERLAAPARWAVDPGRHAGARRDGGRGDPQLRARVPHCSSRVSTIRASALVAKRLAVRHAVRRLASRYEPLRWMRPLVPGDMHTAGECLLTLISQRTSPQGIVTDATSIYWVEYSGQVMKAASTRRECPHPRVRPVGPRVHRHRPAGAPPCPASTGRRRD